MYEPLEKFKSPLIMILSLLRYNVYVNYVLLLNCFGRWYLIHMNYVEKVTILLNCLEYLNLLNFR